MADNIVYITLDNDEIGANVQGSTPQNNAFLNGSVAIDYTTGDVSGHYTITGDVTANQQFTAGGSLKQDPNTGEYSFTDGNLTLTYGSFGGAQPTRADLITYNANPSNISSPTYSSTDEPTPQLTSSTTAPAPCFATGTTITTADGPIAVERLAVGDMALTTSGTYSRVRWIGHRTVDCHRHVRPNEVMPIRILAHAFGANAPARDLVLSPGHSVCVDVGGEALIPASALVNGTSVVRHEVGIVTYWHVELEKHDILLAENLPCESYLDMGNRGFFIEAGVVGLVTLPDAASRTHEDFCRPFHASGAIVDAVRARLAARAVSCGRNEKVHAAA